MKKVISLLLSAIIGFSCVACSASASTVSSDTGQIKQSISTDNVVTLNLITYDFPDDYSIKGNKMTSPMGVSAVSVNDGDGYEVGDLYDGYYTKNITESNAFSSAQEILKAIYDNNDILSDSYEDMVISVEDISVIAVNFTDGAGLLVMQHDTPNFAYVTESADAREDTMDDVMKEVIKQLGSDNDYKTLVEGETTTLESSSNSETDLYTESDSESSVTATSASMKTLEMCGGTIDISLPTGSTTYMESDSSSVVTYYTPDGTSISYADSYVALGDVDALLRDASYNDVGEENFATITMESGDIIAAYYVNHDGYTMVYFFQDTHVDDHYMKASVQLFDTRISSDGYADTLMKIVESYALSL